MLATTAAPAGLTAGGVAAAGATDAAGAVGAAGATWVLVPGDLGGCELPTAMGIIPPLLLRLRARP